MYKQRANWWVWTSVFFVLVLFLNGNALAQDKYPSRPIEIVCPYGPGASTDLVNRVTAAFLNKKWGVPVNVVNKPGGATVPAWLEVYKASPDGYRLYGDSLPATAQMPVAVKNLPFKILDRTFFPMVAMSPMVVMVPSTSPIKNMKELQAEVNKDPENFTWTYLGGAGAIDFAMRQTLKAFGVDAAKTKPVMCQGGAQAATLTAGGHVKMGGGTVSGALPAVRGGTVRALAVTGKNRWHELPDVPTTEEAGFPAINIMNLMGLSGPPKMDASIVSALEKALEEMVKDPESVTRLKNMGCLPYYLDAKATRELATRQVEEVEVLFRLK